MVAVEGVEKVGRPHRFIGAVGERQLVGDRYKQGDTRPVKGRCSSQRA